MLEQGSGTGDQALRAAAESGATVMSFCSGAFALAQAGLGSAAKLRARMADHVGVTPSTHRRRFSRAS